MHVQLAVVVVSGHVDVAAASPAASPTVLDGEALAGVRYHGYSVVSVSSAACVPENSTSVLLASTCNLESDSNRSSG